MYQPPAPPAKHPELDEFAWGGAIEDQEPVFPISSEMTGEIAEYVMEQTVAKILYHSGFEGTLIIISLLTIDFQPFAFDVVTNIAIEYMQDLGRTLTTYLNNTDQRKKFTEEVVILSSTTHLQQEIILHMLDLNGVHNLEQLEMYIKDDIERYGTKLEDCHRRLKRFLTELLVSQLMTIKLTRNAAPGSTRRRGRHKSL